MLLICSVSVSVDWAPIKYHELFIQHFYLVTTNQEGPARHFHLPQSSLHTCRVGMISPILQGRNWDHAERPKHPAPRVALA